MLGRLIKRYAAAGLPGVAVLSFGLGAGMELFMSTVKVNGIGFYDVAKRKQAERLVDAEEELAKTKAALKVKDDSSKQAKTSN
jgi:hypothetical protein